MLLQERGPLLLCWLWMNIVHTVSYSTLDMTTPPSTTSTTINEILKQLNETWNDFLDDKNYDGYNDNNKSQQQDKRRRPFVIVSYAQSIDGFMAPFAAVRNDDDGDDVSDLYDDEAKFKDCESNNSNNDPCNILQTQKATKTTVMYPLSCQSSLIMTHAIRSQVDAIVVGSATVLIDNPRLNNRLWYIKNDYESNNDKDSVSCNGNNSRQPRPVVLDTNLRLVFGSCSTLRMTNPIICCCSEAVERFRKEQKQQQNFHPPQFDILPCDVTSEGHLDLEDVLRKLHSIYGIEKVMVEGGAKVLSSFFYYDLVDSVCITTAPKFLHSGIATSVIAGTGTASYIGPSSPDIVDLNLLEPSIFVLENDIITICRWKAVLSKN